MAWAICASARFMRVLRLSIWRSMLSRTAEIFPSSDTLRELNIRAGIRYLMRYSFFKEVRGNASAEAAKGSRSTRPKSTA